MTNTKVLGKLNSNEKVVIGFTSKFASVICNFPLLSVLGLFGILFIVAFVSGEDIAAIRRGSAAVIILFGSIRILMHLFMKKWCYKVEIDKKSRILTAYSCFNKGFKNVEIANVEVRIGAYCYVCIADQEFIIHVAFIHKLVSQLPGNTSIAYVGNIGKYKEKEWNRTGRPLLPGTAS